MRKLFITGLIFGLLLSVCSCALFDSGPSNQQVKEIFTGYFQKNLPLSWGGSLMGSRLKKLDLVEVKQRGKSLKSGNNGRLPELYAMHYDDCWPVIIHAKGVAMANMIFKQEAHAFDKEGNFLLCKDHFGKWGIEGDVLQ
jgi:hypothetical protein